MANPKTNRVSKMLAVLLALALLAASLPPEPAAARSTAAATCVKNYTVVSGDTLSKIALTFDVAQQDLITANDLKSPYTIFVGQTLCIPGTATTTATTTSTSSSDKSPKLVVTIANNHIEVTAVNFPKKNIYYVKAGEKDFIYGKWIKLGRIKARKDGTLYGLFLEPKGLRNSVVVEVCLKNAVTDEATCTRVRQGK